MFGKDKKYWMKIENIFQNLCSLTKFQFQWIISWLLGSTHLEKSWKQGFCLELTQKLKYLQGLELKKVEDKIAALNWPDPKIEIISRPWVEKPWSSRQ